MLLLKLARPEQTQGMMTTLIQKGSTNAYSLNQTIADNTEDFISPEPDHISVSSKRLPSHQTLHRCLPYGMISLLSMLNNARVDENKEHDVSALHKE